MDAPEPEVEPEAEAVVDEFAAEKLEALTMLTGIVEGSAMPEELFPAFDAADPTLVYFIFKWIKKHYHRDHDDSDFVRGNLKDLTNSYRALTRKAKGGEEDPIVEWFEGSHRYSELPAEEFIDLIVDKLEG
jgi:hypothetical protein